jgi:hypothetical protein
MHLRRPEAVEVICMRPAYVSFAGCFILAAALTPEPAAARTPYDGNWSVLIVTDTGPCDRAYRYGLSIRDGSVMYEGSAAVNVAGRVGKNGVVNVRVWAGRQGADGSGRLLRTTGGGEWRGTGSMGSCAGSWSAERR